VRINRLLQPLQCQLPVARHTFTTPVQHGQIILRHPVAMLSARFEHGKGSRIISSLIAGPSRQWRRPCHGHDRQEQHAQQQGKTFSRIHMPPPADWSPRRCISYRRKKAAIAAFPVRPAQARTSMPWPRWAGFDAWLICVPVSLAPCTSEHRLTFSLQRFFQGEHLSGR
jgi:hypothetical protein